MFKKKKKGAEGDPMDQPSKYIPQLLWGFPKHPLHSYSHSLHSNVGSNKFFVLVYMYQKGGRREEINTFIQRTEGTVSTNTFTTHGASPMVLLQKDLQSACTTTLNVLQNSQKHSIPGMQTFSKKLGATSNF